jgi:hypothetical protein
MTAGELALVLATMLCVLGFVALVLVLVRVLVALRALQAAVDALSARTEPLLDELRHTVEEARESVEEARDDLDRFDQVLGSAEAISARVSGASRTARVALSAPVIKTVALASGTSRAARRLRRNGGAR